MNEEPKQPPCAPDWPDNSIREDRFATNVAQGVGGVPHEDDCDSDSLTRFWSCGPGFDDVEVHVEPPERPHALLEKLGPSPFERGGFPLIGFLATTYDKVTRFAVERE